MVSIEGATACGVLIKKISEKNLSFSVVFEWQNGRWEEDISCIH